MNQIRIGFSNELAFIVLLLSGNVQAFPISGCYILVVPNPGIGLYLEIVTIPKVTTSSMNRYGALNTAAKSF